MNGCVYFGDKEVVGIYKGSGEINTLYKGNEVLPCSAPPFFRMLFDDIANADLMIGGDSSDVSDWNTFFNLPVNGTPFDSVIVNGNEVTLNGGGNLTLSAYLFGDNDPNGTSLLEVEDNGVVIEVEEGCFSDWGTGDGCYALNKIIIPLCVIAGDNAFADIDIINEYNFDSLESCGEFCFYSFSYLNIINLWSLPNIINIGDQAFANLDYNTTLYFPKCQHLGTTVGNNSIFSFTGNTITLTIPSALMTCNAGNPDGDIQYLVANNTVTIIQV